MKKLSRIALAASAFLLASTGAVLYAKDQSLPQPAPATSDAAMSAPADATAPAEKKTAPAATFGKMDFAEKNSAEMGQKYDFIARAIKDATDPLIDDDASNLPPFPATLQLAEFSLPDKKLDFVAYRMTDANYCDNGLCYVSLYVRHNGEWQQMFSLKATTDTYFASDASGVSIMLCGKDGAYEKWTMQDGALDRPIPSDAPGYFVPQGAANDARITTSCPKPPSP